MKPWKISAQFAAYTWFVNRNPDQPEKAAVQFARRNWMTFLPSAHEGIGRLLLKIGEGTRPRRSAARRKLAVAS